MQLPGKATQKVFDEALTFLARDAPPVPGFRKSKGGTDQVIIISTPQPLSLSLLLMSRSFLPHIGTNRFLQDIF